MAHCRERHSGTDQKRRAIIARALWAVMCLLPSAVSYAQTGYNPYVSSRGASFATGGHSLLNSPAEAVPVPLPQQAWEPVDLPFGWRALPEGLLYRGYAAGVKEPKLSAVWLNDPDRGLIWETALGGRVGISRIGDPDGPYGAAQLDLEGGVFARVDPEENSDLDAADFRFGAFMTQRRGPWSTKVGYYHISSHVGDEFMLKHPRFRRRNYVRDSFLAGAAYDVTRDVRVYGEFGYAIGHEGGALPLEFQFGTEFNPLPRSEAWGAPFAAINGHIREDFDYSSSVNVLAGWQWRGRKTNRVLRAGLQYYNGPSLQYSFTDLHEELFGGGLWVEY